MTWFAWYAFAIVGYEALALATGDRWPPTITELVRRLRGVTQGVVAVLIVLPALAHLFEWIA